MKPTIIILGSTAVGKTASSIELSRKLNGEIISADAFLVYRGMDIGTAKPTMEERQGIFHHLIDIRNPDEEWTVSDFVGETQKAKIQIQNKGKLPIIVGGTGLYLWSLIEGFAFSIIPSDKELRSQLEKESPASLYAELLKVDPLAASKINQNDKKRTMRALEVYRLTGKPISELQKARKPREEQGEYLLIGLNLPREELYLRINQRVDKMIAGGLIEEVRGLLGKGYSKELLSMRALGYKETIDYLAGKYSKDALAEEIKKRSRNLARRQLTWFRRFRDVNWFAPKETEKVLAIIKKRTGSEP